jgi:hypothetical protein
MNELLAGWLAATLALFKKSLHNVGALFSSSSRSLFHLKFIFLIIKSRLFICLCRNFFPPLLGASSFQGSLPSRRFFFSLPLAVLGVLCNWENEKNKKKAGEEVAGGKKKWRSASAHATIQISQAREEVIMPRY